MKEENPPFEIMKEANPPFEIAMGSQLPLLIFTKMII